MADYLFENRGKPSSLTFKKWLEYTLRTSYQKMVHSSAAATIEKYENDLNKAIQRCKRKNAGKTNLENVAFKFKGKVKYYNYGLFVLLKFN